MTTFDASQLTFVGPPKLADHQLVNSSESNEWYTPAVYVEAARAVMGSIDLDPASCHFANRIVQARRYYTIHDDGLTKPWCGNVWLNPPYGRLNGKSNQALWTNKLIFEYKTGLVRQAVLLVNVATGTRWFSPLWEYPICFVAGRIDFYTDGHNLGQGGATHDNAIVYLGENESRFIEVFGQFGPVVRRVSTPLDDGQLCLAELGCNTDEIDEICSLTDDERPSADLPPDAPAGAWIEEKLIPRNGRTYGPYRYLRWRENGRLRSRYLGKAKS